MDYVEGQGGEYHEGQDGQEEKVKGKRKGFRAKGGGAKEVVFTRGLITIIKSKCEVSILRTARLDMRSRQPVRACLPIYLHM